MLVRPSRMLTTVLQPHARAYTHLHADRAPHKHDVPSRSHNSVHDVHVEVIYDAVNVDAVNVGNHVAKLAATFDPAPDTLPTPTLWPLGTAAIDSAMVVTTVMALIMLHRALSTPCAPTSHVSTAVKQRTWTVWGRTLCLMQLLAASHTADACRKGQFQETDKSCTACPAGRFQPAGSGMCIVPL